MLSLFKIVCMDTAPVTIYPGKTEVFFVTVDFFPKWVYVRTAASKTIMALAAFLRFYIFQRNGFPDNVLTDNGPTYVRTIFQDEYQ